MRWFIAMFCDIDDFCKRFEPIVHDESPDAPVGQAAAPQPDSD
jgi:hypothetical protein